MRLSSQYMFQRSIEGMRDAMNKNTNIYSSLAAGQTLLKPSDDPAGASQAIIYQDALATIDRYSTGRLHAQDSLGQEDSVLSSISNLLTKNLTEKIVAAGNGAYSDADRQALATELQGIRNNLLDLGNTRNSNGRYIFSGYKTSTIPFNKEGVYQGGDTAISQNVSDSSSMQVGHTGSDVFMSGTEDDIFGALDNVIEALNKPVESDEDREALQSVLDSANVSLKKGIDNLGKIQAQVGTQLQQLDILDNSAMTQRTQLQTRLEQTVGSDPDSWTKLVSASKMSDFAMTASMTVFQAMQKVSIFSMV